MKAAELCAGYGGLALAVEEVFGAETAWVSEFEDAPSRILKHHWPDVPNHGDMTKIDWTAVEPVDIISGGTPCQDLSAAGRRAGMTEGTRSNLWVQMREAIATIQPTYVVWENVRGAYSAEAHSDLEHCPGCMGHPSDRGAVLRALGRVLGDLSDLGYDCQWRGLRAADVGAPHGRFRVFVLATRRAQPSDADNTGSQRPHDSARTTPARLGGHTEQGASGDTTQDADLTTRGERRITTPGPTESGRARANTGGRSRTPTTNADRGERDGRKREQIRSASGRKATAGNREGLPSNTTGDAGRKLDGDSSALAIPASIRGREGRPEHARIEGRPDALLSGDVTWGAYGPAIRRWEQALGRRAPAPTEPTGRNGGHRLSARFAEWMMGVPDGWIVDVPGITRNEALKAAGNGVVPQQAIAALRDMLRAQARQEAA